VTVKRAEIHKTLKRWRIKRKGKTAFSENKSVSKYIISQEIYIVFTRDAAEYVINLYFPCFATILGMLVFANKKITDAKTKINEKASRLSTLFSETSFSCVH
jgi:hypothetical protein